MRKMLCLSLGTLLLGVLFYAAWLTSDWRALLDAAPAELGIVAIVCGLVAGVFFSDREEKVLAAPLLVPVNGDSPRLRPEPPRGTRVTYNERKIRAALAEQLEIPEKYTHKRRRPREVAQVVDAKCTGCGICVPFCPTDCIEVAAVEPWMQRSIAPVRVRYDECIGCGICMRVCAKLAWDATIMRPAEEIEREEGIVIHDTFPGRQDRFDLGF